MEFFYLFSIFINNSFIDLGLELFILIFETGEFIWFIVLDLQNVETIIRETFLAPYRGDCDTIAVGTLGAPMIKPIEMFVLYFL